MYQKLQSYEVQFLRYGVRQFFFSFWAIFLPFTTPYPPPPPPNIPENQIFEKMKKESGVVIILCNKKHDQMKYVYSDIECNKHNFCSFTPLLTPKIKIWRKCEKHLEILSSYTCAP